MRIACPLCGERDLREFTYRGAAVLLDRPEVGDAAAFDAYLHLRDNPAGPNAELWHHAFGCRAWLRVVRDTRSHAIREVGLAREARAVSAAGVAVGAATGAAAEGGAVGAATDAGVIAGGAVGAATDADVGAAAPEAERGGSTGGGGA
ncbi:sarcosine oxidase subunit delta [Amaricoccus sp.]|uniref:sarcosine oxidase subunit delta n=1 Tax=Amaricoccus sp. TaxID=1872485 RepID=UPI001B566457|nr:sarcosine oxidase subunit delta [Amaricoccus sp.]